MSLPLCIYPLENIQTSAGYHPSNTGECKTPHHRPAKTYFHLFLATPTDSGQWNSSPSSLELHCQSKILVTVDNTVLLSGGVAFVPIFRRWISFQPNRKSHHHLTKTCNPLCLSNQTDKYACQWSSSPPAQSFTGSHIFQLDLLGTVNYTVFVSWWVVMQY